jgi:hypothetical protein
VKGIEIYAAKINEDGTISKEESTDRFVNDCSLSAWSPVRYCPVNTVATGIEGYFTEGGDFTGIALHCAPLQVKGGSVSNRTKKG